MDDSLTRRSPWTVRVLLVEDDPHAAEGIRVALAANDAVSFQVSVATDVESALAMLMQQMHHVVLLDLTLPEGHGLTALLRAKEAAPTVPIVVLGQGDDDALALDAVSLGAQDYVAKDRSPGNLVSTVLNAIQRHRTLTELRAAHRREHFLATHDALTGLLNRLAFLERVRESIARARRSGERLALLFIDLDGFKRINDTLGHSTGDEALRIAAARIRACLRAGDPVCRFGGDEFAALVHGMRRDEDLAIVTRRVLADVERPLRLTDTYLALAASIGIAVYPTDGSEPEELLRNADAAMYQAKAEARGTYCFYSDGANVVIANRLRLENGLRQALDREELSLHYQPQVDVVDDTIPAVEALLRWRDPDGGIASPADFLPAAEGLGLVNRIGEWVVANALRDAAGWQRELGRELFVCVNASRSQIAEGGFPDVIERAVRDAGIEPHRLELELGETALDKNLDEVKRVLQRLRRIGVRIALGQFGAGLGTFGVVRHVPCDTIKIASSLVHDAVCDDTAAAIVQSIVELGRCLCVRVVAVGVEEEGQVEALRRLGCSLMQGHQLAPPTSPEELRELLSRPGVRGRQRPPDARGSANHVRRS